MPNARNAPARRERRPDRGSTEKISVSLDREQEGREDEVTPTTLGAEDWTLIRSGAPTASPYCLVSLGCLARFLAI